MTLMLDLYWHDLHMKPYDSIFMYEFKFIMKTFLQIIVKSITDLKSKKITNIQI